MNRKGWESFLKRKGGGRGEGGKGGERVKNGQKNKFAWGFWLLFLRKVSSRTHEKQHEESCPR